MGHLIVAQEIGNCPFVPPPPAVGTHPQNILGDVAGLLLMCD